MKLKPCPFCGSEYAQVRYMGGKWQKASAFKSGYRGECCDCGAITAAYDTEDKAIAAWNARCHFGLTYEDYNILLDELGVSKRTCKMVVSGTPCEGNTDVTCTGCGAYNIGMFYDGNGHRSTPRFCPNCGAKVVVE